MNLKGRLTKWLLTSWIGNIQVFKKPFFVIIGSTSYTLKGEQEREVLNIVKKGDVLVRRYDKYISGLLIPGYWVHAGVYVGHNRVVHAVLDHGVTSEDILTFMRTDALAILRTPTTVSKRAVKEAAERAESLIGKLYDFAFDFESDIRFCCTEVVKYAFAEIPEINIPVRDRGVSKGTVAPDDLLEANFEVVYDSRVKKEEREDEMVEDPAELAPEEVQGGDAGSEALQ